MTETLLTGGVLVVAWWLVRDPEPGAPLWTWQAWRLPDVDASYDYLRIRTTLDGLPIRRHDGTTRVWPDQGTSDVVADVAAIRAQRDFTWRKPVAVGAAGLAFAGAGASRPPMPYVTGDGRTGWTHTQPSGTGWPGQVVESGPPSIIMQGIDWPRFDERAAAIARSYATQPTMLVLKKDTDGMDLDRFKARWREAARRGSVMVLGDGPTIETITHRPAPSDVMALDLIQARLSAGLSTVVADALSSLLAMA